MTKARLLTFALALACAASGCHATTVAQREREAGRRRRATVEAGAAAASATPAQIATLEDRSIDESSGIVASRRNPGLFWTHNDSGDGPLVYAFDRAGRSRGAWRVEGAQARDWEDTGENEEGREFVPVPRSPEPKVTAAAAAPTKENPGAPPPAEAIRLKY